MRNYDLFDNPANAWRPEINARPVAPVTACMVGKRIYTTPYMAAKNEAWYMICEKHVERDTLPKGLLGKKTLRNMTCSCRGRNPQRCPLHDHDTGYFARLHKRLTRQLAAKYKRDLARIAAEVQP